jgi:DNA repair and recombination protein RAD54B
MMSHSVVNSHKIPYPSVTANLNIDFLGKMIALDKLLATLYRYTDEKIVLVSNYTSTLDMLESHCTRSRYNVLRLDGSTAQKNRQDLVDSFNRGSQQQSFAFLLSAKAGGVGLNLIG